VNTGVNSRNGFGNSGVSGRTNGNTGGNRSNLNPNAGENGLNSNGGGGRSNLNPNAGETGANGISQNPFFSNQNVRQQLKLNDTQYNSLNRAYQNAYTNYNTRLNGLGKNLTSDQRAQQMEALQNQFNDRFNQSVNSTLSDPSTRTRFEQLNRQYMGLSNFNNPAIQKQLNLTPAQLNQFRQLSTSMRSQESGANANGSNGQNQYAQTWERINSILTPEQQQTWSQLTGERFDFGNAGGGNGSRGAAGTAQNGIGTGGSQLQNGTGNGGAAGNQNSDPSNNLTAPRPGTGITPFDGASGTNGTGTNNGATGEGANGAGAAQGSAGTSGGSGSATNGSSSSK